MGYTCDWAVVCYGGDDALLSSICYEGKNLGTSIIYCEKTRSVEDLVKSLWEREDNLLSNGSSLLNGDHGYYPKPILLFNLFQHLPKYRWIWLTDDDIDIGSANITRFVTVVASPSLSPPILIAQPLLKGFTSYSSLKWATWLPENSSQANSTLSLCSDYEMKRITFVEMVAPLFNAQFFHWFVTVVVPLIIRPMYLLEADHGIDRIWCQTAKFFHEQQRQKEVRRSVPISASASASSSVCGLFVSERDSIRHLSLKSFVAGKSQEASAQHAKNQSIMNEVMKAAFPEWFLHFY